VKLAIRDRNYRDGGILTTHVMKK